MKIKKTGLVPMRGFTLIELLVVIAIMGILASLMLTSLGKSRDKAKGAAIREELTTMRTSAELYRSKHGDFTTGDCGDTNTGMWEDEDINRVVMAIKSNAVGGEVICLSDGGNWALSTVSPDSPNNIICIDSSTRILEGGNGAGDNGHGEGVTCQP